MVELAFGKKPIIVKWIYKVKNDYSGTPSKYKARLMAKGFEQKEGLDFQKTFVSIIEWNTIIFVVALTAHFRWRISQMDVKIMFLNHDLKKEVYLMQLEGFIQTRKEHLVSKLNKTLYGLQ